ncbi:FPR2 [Symbiodinium natans]|uniref:peptidylprolyl isomerase n=1 Tax=Symbiodinium natans TaxID=878477 RepID=A0A812LWP3_9DINO|nr:FPR2 [Symbiodinium natans]
MALKFHWVSVPLAMVIATAYLYYVTQYKPSQKKAKLLQAVDMKVTHKPEECFLQAGDGDLVHVHYTSFLKKEGTQFETTRGGDPYVLKLGKCKDHAKPECMKGFQTALLGMCAGEKRKATVPPKLGFDKKGRPSGIRADEHVIFHLEMVDIDKA